MAIKRTGKAPGPVPSAPPAATARSRAAAKPATAAAATATAAKPAAASKPAAAKPAAAAKPVAAAKPAAPLAATRAATPPATKSPNETHKTHKTKVDNLLFKINTEIKKEKNPESETKAAIKKSAQLNGRNLKAYNFLIQNLGKTKNHIILIKKKVDDYTKDVVSKINTINATISTKESKTPKATQSSAVINQTELDNLKAALQKTYDLLLKTQEVAVLEKEARTINALAEDIKNGTLNLIPTPNLNNPQDKLVKDNLNTKITKVVEHIINAQNVEAQKAELETKKEELETKKEELETKKEELETKKAELETEKAKLESEGFDMLQNVYKKILLSLLKTRQNFNKLNMNHAIDPPNLDAIAEDNSSKSENHFTSISTRYILLHALKDYLHSLNWDNTPNFNNSKNSKANIYIDNTGRYLIIEYILHIVLKTLDTNNQREQIFSDREKTILQNDYENIIGTLNSHKKKSTILKKTAPPTPTTTPKQPAPPPAAPRAAQPAADNTPAAAPAADNTPATAPAALEESESEQQPTQPAAAPAAAEKPKQPPQPAPQPPPPPPPQPPEILLEIIAPTFYKALKDIMPTSLIEIILYVLLVLSIILFIKLIEYTNIQKYIKETRCYKKAMSSKYSADTYIIKGYTMERVEILKIVYDFKSKDSTFEIKAPKGKVLNKIKFPLYNLRTRDIDEIEKVFYSEIDYELLNSNMLYEGNAELVQFMQILSTRFFENKFESDLAKEDLDEAEKKKK
jgi:hypothetical protein